MAEETDRGLPREVNSSSHRPHLNITHTVWVRRMIFVAKNEEREFVELPIKEKKLGVSTGRSILQCFYFRKLTFTTTKSTCI